MTSLCHFDVFDVWFSHSEANQIAVIVHDMTSTSVNLVTAGLTCELPRHAGNYLRICERPVANKEKYVSWH